MQGAAALPFRSRDRNCSEISVSTVPADLLRGRINELMLFRTNGAREDLEIGIGVGLVGLRCMLIAESDGSQNTHDSNWQPGGCGE